MIHTNWIRNQKLNLNHNAAIQLLNEFLYTVFFYSESLLDFISLFLLAPPSLYLYLYILSLSLSLSLCIPPPVAIHPFRTQYSIMLAPFTHGARICKPFKEPWNRFPAWRAGTTTLFDVPRAARLNRLAESIPWNRFLGFLNVYKYGLWRLLPLTLHSKPFRIY